LTVVAWWTRDRIALAAAILGPPALAGVLAPLRAGFANTDAALVLVLLVVAVAANGYRLAGVLAALSAGAWFDFFLTAPFETFAINDRTDIETTVLLLLVGSAVTELAVWGRRQQAEAGRQAGYFAGIQDAADTVASGTSPTIVIDQVCDQLTRIVGLRRCRFDYDRGVVGGDRPRLRQDGQVAWRGGVYDVEHDGLASDREIELLLSSGAEYRGAFLLTAEPGSRPSLAQRLVAVALADRAGATLAQHHSGQD
jgi:K+-sensing histidine kinase KdpD